MVSLESFVLKISEILNISKEETTEIIKQAFTQDDPFQFLSDLLGYSNIDLIFEIYKFKDEFIEKEYKNEQAMFIEHVMPEKPMGNRSSTPLVSTATLGDDGKYFSYEKLNLVQSTVFHNIYNSDGNTLVAAPTGAGKTDVALLAILRALRHNNSQIIYIVPMKALASEIYSKYSKLFSGRYFIIEYTGDTEIDSKTAARARIIICTPEKFDVATRKLYCVFQNIKLIIIDEIHLLEDDRGPVLESIVARIDKISELKQTFIRIIGLSATLPNYQDVASFIKAKHVHFFNQSYRPVPLKMTVTGFTKVAKYKDELDYLLMKVQEYLNDDKQILIFVHSRAKTHKIANFLMKNLINKKLSNNMALIKGLSNDLHSFALNTIGVHHAGLQKSDRSQMESLFHKKLINVLVTTSTLAWGVNLPAYAVIIHGHTFYNPHLGQFTDISILDVLQIFGRAGRPQFDTKGEAILMVSCDKIDKYVGLLKRNKDIESKMLYHVPENLNAEIYLNHVFSIVTALNWIKNTFLYVRMLKNPAMYGILPNEIGLEEQALSEYIYLTIKRLEDCRLIDITKKETNYNTWTFESTFYGQIASIYYLNHLTMYSWLKGLDSINNELSLIDLLLKSEEFKAITIRNDEMSHLNAIHEDLLLNSIIHFEFDETSEAKRIILFISFLHFKKMQNFSLGCDTDFIIENMKRLISAMNEILLYLKRYDLFLISFELEKKIFRYKKTINSDVSIKITRISDDFADIKLFNINTPSTVFLIDKNVPFYAFQTTQASHHIFRCNINNIKVEVHTNDHWSIYKTTVKMDVDYSPFALYNYGIHCCDTQFRLSGIRNDCPHFKDNSLVHKFNESLVLVKEYKTCKEETFSNIVNETFYIRMKFIEMKSNNYRECLRLMSYKISKMKFDSVLIVCPNISDVDETLIFLNTQASLESQSIEFKYEKGSKPLKNNKFWICTFEDALNITDFDIVILKGVGSGKGIYPIFEILKICNNRKSIIYENSTNIDYLQSIILNAQLN